MRSRILVSFTTLVVLLSVIGIILEILVRNEEKAFRTEVLKRNNGEDLCFKRSSNPQLVYELAPNKCGYNSIGQKDKEHDHKKAKGTFRIGVIGDSVAEGVGVDDGECFPNQTEMILRNMGYDLEVLKFAVRGYSTSQQIELLKETEPYDLDLIIWSYVLNDPTHPIYHTSSTEMGRFFHEPRSYAIHWLRKRLFLIKEQILSYDCQNEYHAKLHCIYRDNVEMNLNEVQRLTPNIPVLFMVHPTFVRDGYASYPLNDVHEDLLAIAKSAGMPVFDLLDEFKKYSNSELKNTEREGEWFDPWHPNRNGHKVIARALVQRLIDSDLLAGSPRTER